VARANKLGMIIDLAHADEETAFATLDASTSPRSRSHTGPRALQEFPRYISDELMKSIAKAGGLIGLWLFTVKKWVYPTSKPSETTRLIAPQSSAQNIFPLALT